MSSEALKNEFLLESFENLSNIDQELTQLEKNPNDDELLNSIYRTVHTMKGSSAFLGLSKLQEVTHHAENLLDKLREKELDVGQRVIDVLLKSFDVCKFILKNIENHGVEGELDVEPVKRILQKCIDDPEYAKASRSKENTDSSDGELDNLISIHKDSDGQMTDEAIVEKSQADSENSEESTISAAALESLKELADAGSLDPELLKELQAEGNSDSQASEDSIGSELQNKEDEESLNNISANMSEAAEDNEEEDTSQKDVKNSIADTVVRVNVSVLDKIMNTVGELVLNRNQFLQTSSRANDGEIARLSNQLDIITSELQSEVMSTRMQPIGNILTKFERLVRDLARDNNKKISLKLSGQDTELDRTLIEAIKDPLVHIVRNSADHGIEDIQTREKLGKSPDGVIHIKAYNESGQVTIEISDNGKGIDKDRVVQKAVEKGIISQDQVANLKDNQILNLIFNPGFSTAEKITNISGRGVGMDVVKTNIEKIGGSVNVKSVQGEGTTFKLRIPLTLAIVPALIVKSNSQKFAIPQLNLVELVRLEGEKELKDIEEIQGAKFLRLRGKLTPLFSLSKCLELEKAEEINKILNGTEDLEEERNLFRTENSKNIAILNSENNVYGLEVDEILDTQEIVVKPLNSSLKDLGVFGGVTIMGDGSVSVIIDAVGFLNKFSTLKESSIYKNATNEDKEEYELNLDAENQENLLFKLNDDRIYALPLTLVSRLEEFNSNQIEYTGNQPVVKYLDRPMPLVNLEKILKLDGDSNLQMDENVTFQSVVVNFRDQNYALVVNKILDISIERITLDSSTVDRPGILGTIFVNDKVVSLLDLISIIDSLPISKQKNKVEIDPIFKEKKVLVVDDSIVYRKLGADVLQSNGMQVIIAENGEQGLELLRQNPDINLILTDIEMPVMDGFKFITEVRSNDQFKHLPVLAVSTRVSPEDREKGVAAGFNAHLEKFNSDSVLREIKNLLS